MANNLEIYDRRKSFQLLSRCNTICSMGGSSTFSSASSDFSTLCDAPFEKADRPGDCPSTVTLKLADSHLPPQPVASDVTDQELPPKSGSRLYRWMRWTFFSTYRRLFTVVFLTNTAVLTNLVARTAAGRGGITFYSTITAASINLAVSIIFRQEHVINLLFRMSTAISPTSPLFVRRWIAKIYGYGGLHSGCATAAVFWYTAFACLVTYHATSPPYIDLGTIVITYANILLLLLMIIFSHPILRNRMHNWFEATHRFAGWTAVGLFWAQTMLTAWNDRARDRKASQALGHQLLITPAFWCLVLITLCIVYPWLRLRKRAVVHEKLSDHAIRLHFSHANVDMCQAIRLGDNPLKETHAFAVIAKKTGLSEPPLETSEKSTPSGCPHCSHCCKLAKAQTRSSAEAARSNTQTKGFSVVVSRAGDWTSRIIDNPPSSLYIRGTPVYGVLRVATLFSPVLIVATGSGIGPCLSLFYGRPNLNCRVLWSTPSPLETYGQGIVDDVLTADPNARIVDTRRLGRRPDLTRMAYSMWKRGGCEAVILISNPKVTRKVIYGLESRGVPAFAPIFDS